MKSIRSFTIAAVAIVALVVAVAVPMGFAQEADTPARPAQPQEQPATDDRPQTATLGQLVPDFTLKNHEGNDVTLSELRGKIVVLEWFDSTCPAVKHHYQERTRTMIRLAEKFAEQDVVWLAVNSSQYGTREIDANAVKEWSMPFPVLHDRDGRVGRLFGATHTPHMFIIDKAGKLVYQGGIDDNPYGRRAETTPYVENALNDLVNERAVATPRTRAYG